MKRGFPRPLAFITRTSRSPYARGDGSYGKRWDGKNYPWPYSASTTKVSNLDRGRMKECFLFKRCGTCGEAVVEEEVGLILYNPRSKGVQGNDVLHHESGPYHLKCLVLNFTKCPHLAATKQFMPAYGSWKDVRPQLAEIWALG